MKKGKIYMVVMIMLLCVVANSSICQASENETISTYQYKEKLLVSYKEYWYTDGSGTESYVRYDEQYREYTFINGYKATKRVTPIPITGELPSKTTRHNSVKVTYTFY